MPRRNEIPYPNTEQTWYSGGTEHTSGPLPDTTATEPKTALEALMVAGTGEPVVSLEERQPLIEAIQRCVDRLGEPDRSMVEGFFFEGNYRAAGSRAGISKSAAHRRMPAVLNRLKTMLLREPLIRERLGYGQEDSDSPGGDDRSVGGAEGRRGEHR